MSVISSMGAEIKRSIGIPRINNRGLTFLTTRRTAFPPFVFSRTAFSLESPTFSTPWENVQFLWLRYFSTNGSSSVQREIVDLRAIKERLVNGPQPSSMAEPNDSPRKLE